ncbi:uncharacterized protein MYCFIDRAFT_213337 [Pseudocercospora fijiensis CIRAD86]|uniref:Carboxymuconolactone decarboxylase-like domain-containing protein n=1 Tax=Pseudocercospora fijiensis (strain CIRAD86) TaxID=383855 RepID=N1QBL6_PSEFD|nr:uncharacterized protein MYCFIDRAFT_213337 [Pseudocercospora fijiensis CIRAD86]EME88568.1 hypothetical protein MYCFIDRAFT_213337 [Pseudocercospora fijiensis CIRAD86]
MSDRIPPLPRDQLNPDQQAFQDHFIASVQRIAPHPGAADRASKTVFPVLAVLPKAGQHSVDLLVDLEEETKGYLPKDAAETVSLLTTTYFKSDYVTHVHKTMDVTLGILTQAQADAITAGKKPEDLNEHCSLAYDAAWHLLDTRGPFPKELYEKCVQAFKLEGTVGLVHFVALLTWTALGLNVANVPVPKGPPPS